MNSKNGNLANYQQRHEKAKKYKQSEPPATKEVVQQVGVGSSKFRVRSAQSVTKQQQAPKERNFSQNPSQTKYSSKTEPLQQVRPSRGPQTGMPETKHLLSPGMVLTSNKNGQGLWVHQQQHSKASLPPISQKPKQQHPDTVAADLRAERSVNQVLEQKYCEAMQEVETQQQKMALQAQEADQAKRLLDLQRSKHEKAIKDLEQAVQLNRKLTAELERQSSQVQSFDEQAEKMNKWASQVQEHYQSLQSDLQAVVQGRRADAQRQQSEIEELQSVIQEYADESTRLQQELGALGDQPTRALPVDKFKQAFGESQVETSTKLKLMDEELKKLKAKYKSEEEQRRRMQEANRRREDEVKGLRLELEKVQKVLADEEQLRQRDRTVMLQKENKVKLLEVKLGGKVEAKPEQPKPRPVVQKLVTEGPPEQTSKQIVDSIKKRPVKMAEEASPVIVKKKIQFQEPPNLVQRLESFKPPPIPERKLKSFIRAKPQKDSSDDDAPPTDTMDFADHEEEIIPIQAKPFLFGDK